MKKLILVLLLSPVLIGCPDALEYSYPYYIVNNSAHSIGWYHSDGRNGRSAYPDTSLPFTKEFVMDIVTESGKTRNLSPQTPWEETFKNLPADTLSVFIFHTDTLKKYSWQEVRDGYKVLKRYDLSLEDIKRMNYTITYP